MSKFGRKVSALLLAAAVAVSTAVPAFAASSPVSGKTGSDTTVYGDVTNETVSIDKVVSEGKTAVVPGDVTSGDKTYSVSEIKTGAITKKYNKVTLYLHSSAKVREQIAKNKNAKKTKKIVIEAVDKKLKASHFSKKAFKGFKGKIIVKKSAMSKKEFKKLVKRLRKGGFKGKIYRQ